MQVRVLFFGVLKEIFGGENQMITMPAESCVQDLLDRFAADTDASRHIPSLAVAVNREYSRGDTVLREGDEVALLPPVSGGAS